MKEQIWTFGRKSSGYLFHTAVMERRPIVLLTCDAEKPGPIPHQATHITPNKQAIERTRERTILLIDP
jgi:hypothetical protein